MRHSCRMLNMLRRIMRFAEFGEIALMTAPWLPYGFNTITPNIIADDAEQAVNFLKQALGATESYPLTLSDGRITRRCLAKLRPPLDFLLAFWMTPTARGVFRLKRRSKKRLLTSRLKSLSRCRIAQSARGGSEP
jgi:hypothetical protein